MHRESLGAGVTHAAKRHSRLALSLAAEATRADGTVAPGRGWCALESGASDEMVARLAFFPKVAAKLAGLPAKLVEIGDGAPRAVEAEAAKEGAGPRIERIRAALGDEARTQFTGRGDRPVVVRMFNKFVLDVGNTVNAAGNALPGPPDQPHLLAATPAK